MSEKPFSIEVVERPQNPEKKLGNLLLAASERMNQEAEREFGLKGLVDKDGSLSMPGYAKSNGGIYSKDQMKNFGKEIFETEITNSMAYRKDRGSPEFNQTINTWREGKKKSKAQKIEQVIMLLFYKVLKDEFMVVRSAVYDDYTAGVDKLLVNKKTGEAICAIDDFHEGNKDSGKAEKVTKKALKGGAEIKFGLGVKEGKIVRTEMRNLPVFCLGITSEQFEALVSSMGSNLDAPLSSKEQEIFLEFVTSLQKQQQTLAELELKPSVKQNVTGLSKVLEKMKAKIGNPGSVESALAA